MGFLEGGTPLAWPDSLPHVKHGASLARDCGASSRAAVAPVAAAPRPPRLLHRQPPLPPSFFLARCSPRARHPAVHQRLPPREGPPERRPEVGRRGARACTRQSPPDASRGAAQHLFVRIAPLSPPRFIAAPQIEYHLVRLDARSRTSAIALIAPEIVHTLEEQDKRTKLCVLCAAA